MKYSLIGAQVAASMALLASAQRDSLQDDINAGFFDDILAGEPPAFARGLSVPDTRDFIPTPRSLRGFKVGGSSKQHHTVSRSKDARKARAATRKNRK